MPFTVVFIVTSSVQSIPNAVRAQGQSSRPDGLYSRVERRRQRRHCDTATVQQLNSCNNDGSGENAEFMS